MESTESRRNRFHALRRFGIIIFGDIFVFFREPPNNKRRSRFMLASSRLSFVIDSAHNHVEICPTYAMYLFPMYLFRATVSIQESLREIIVSIIYLYMIDTIPICTPPRYLACDLSIFFLNLLANALRIYALLYDAIRWISVSAVFRHLLRDADSLS